MVESAVEHHGHRAYRNGFCTGNRGGATSTGSPLAALTRNEPRSQRRSGKYVAKKDLDNSTFRLSRFRESCHRKDDWLNIGDDPYLSQAVIRMARRGDRLFGNGKATRSWLAWNWLAWNWLPWNWLAWSWKGLPGIGKAWKQQGLPGIGKKWWGRAWTTNCPAKTQLKARNASFAASTRRVMGLFRSSPGMAWKTT